MSEEHRYELGLRLALVVLLMTVGVVSFDRARRGEFDFEHFYHDACYVWQHGDLPPMEAGNRGEQRRLPFYLPVVSLLLAPLTAGGRVPMALVWAAGQVAALGYSLRVLRRWAGETPPSATQRTGPARGGLVLALAAVLAVPALTEAAKFNQLSFFVLALVLGASQALDRERPRWAGVLLGLTALLKLLPGIFLVWLLLKRRWSAAAALVGTVVALAFLPALAAFGWQRTLAYHRQWWSYNVAGDAARGLLNPELREHFIDHRNQSIAQVLARLTWAEHPYRVRWQPAQLAPQTCTRAAYGIAGGLLIVLARRTRRRWQELDVHGRHAEVAAYAIAMLALSPLVRQYYLVWVLPALVLFAREALLKEQWHAGSTRALRARIGWLGLGTWLIGMAAWLSETARAYGAHLVLLVVIGVLMLWTTARLPAENAPANGEPAGATRRPQGADAMRDE